MSSKHIRGFFPFSFFFFFLFFHCCIGSGAPLERSPAWRVSSQQQGQKPRLSSFLQCSSFCKHVDMYWVQLFRSKSNKQPEREANCGSPWGGGGGDNEWVLCLINGSGNLGPFFPSRLSGSSRIKFIKGNVAPSIYSCSSQKSLKWNTIRCLREKKKKLFLGD